MNTSLVVVMLIVAIPILGKRWRVDACRRIDFSLGSL
jgi:hypothetical protein